MAKDSREVTAKGASPRGTGLVSLDEHGMLARLDVLIRPANAIEALREVVAPRMMDLLSRRRGEGGWGSP